MKVTKTYLLLACLLVAGIGLIDGLISLYTSKVTQKEGIIYDLKSGTSITHLKMDLIERRIITSPRLFELYLYYHSEDQLKVGEYLFPKGSTPISIWKQVTTGRGLVQHRFTIIPGWTFKQLKQALLENAYLRHATETLSDDAIMAALGQATLKPEGYFFPETYYITKGMSDLALLKRAYHMMEMKLLAAWNLRAPALPFASPYEALIAASLVEKEAYLNTERPMIAGVLVNRLKQGMPLQFDPTVIYGLGDRYRGSIYRSDLKEENPYNTYLNKGLPPTPIGIPSLSSILAVLHPTVHHALYFVVKGQGAHQFSDDLASHNLAVAKAAHLLHPTASSFFNTDLCLKYLTAIFSMARLQEIPYVKR